jgi:hypothetical protein
VSSQLNRNTRLGNLHQLFIIFPILILVFTSPSTSFLSFGPEHYASGQKISQIQIAKVFLDDAIKALKKNDIIGASYRLNLSKQQIENAPTNTSIQAAKVFIQDALQALDTFNVSKAIERINLAKQGLTSSSDHNGITPTIVPKTRSPKPKSQIGIPTPPLTLQTERGTYFIRLYWDPVVIEPGKITKFGVLFMDRSHSVLNQVSYDFIAKSSKGTVLELKNQKAPHGNGIQSIRFTQSGPATVNIKVVAIGDNSLGEFAEGADFEIVVKELSTIHRITSSQHNGTNT